MKGIRSYYCLKEEKEYLKMIGSNLISRFGDSIDAVAFGWMVYSLTQSATWLAIILGVNGLPNIILQPFAGAFIDRLDKKKTLIVCDLGRGLCVLLTGILLGKQLLAPWMLLIITFVNTSFEALRVPAGISVIPNILKKENYTFGMSANQGMCRVAELAGIGTAGMIIAFLGIGGAVILDGVTFLLSSFVLSFLRLSYQESSYKNKKKTSYIENLKGGFSYFKNNSIIFHITTLCFFINIILVPWENLKAGFISESLKIGVTAMSVSGIGASAGLVIGTIVFPLSSKKLTAKNMMTGSGALIGILYVALMLTKIPNDELVKLFLYGILNVLFGIVNSCIGLALSVTFMSNTEEEYLGRAGSLFTAFAMSAGPIASLTIACFTPYFSIDMIYLATGIFTIALFVFLYRKKDLVY